MSLTLPKSGLRHVGKLLLMTPKGASSCKAFTQFSTLATTNHTSCAVTRTRTYPNSNTTARLIGTAALHPATHLPPNNNISPVVSAYIRTAIADQRRGLTSRFNFDTYKLVRQLERQGFTRGQAVAIMRTINALLVDSTLSIRSEILSKTDMENQTYLYKAHLQELRNELQLLRQNDSATLKSDTDAITREIETLNSKFTEMVGQLKSEIGMDINNHKTDGREVGTDTDLRIQEIHHRLIIKLSDLKTKIETMKVETTTVIIWFTIGAIGLLLSIDWLFPNPVAKPAPASKEPTMAFGFPSPFNKPPAANAPPAPPQPVVNSESQSQMVANGEKILR